MTRVLPNPMSTEAVACGAMSKKNSMGRSWSGVRPSGLGMPAHSTRRHGLPTANRPRSNPNHILDDLKPQEAAAAPGLAKLTIANGFDQPGRDVVIDLGAHVPFNVARQVVRLQHDEFGHSERMLQHERFVRR